MVNNRFLWPGTLWCHQTWLAGESPNWIQVLMEKSPMNDAFSTAAFDYRRVNEVAMSISSKLPKLINWYICSWITGQMTFIMLIGEGRTFIPWPSSLEQRPFQDPTKWRYLQYMRPLFQPKIAGNISAMAKDMILTDQPIYWILRIPFTHWWFRVKM